jgi:AcrR family transcriptional regulator
MRVTAETKERTRQAILEAARSRFQADGFEEATTRDIAREAGIATGTLFNYFATKEAIALALIADAIQQHTASPSAIAVRGSRTAAPAGEPETLEEALFAQAAASLRVLKPYRKYLAPVLDTAWSPLARSGAAEADALRAHHLERVVDLARRHGVLLEPASVPLQIYWTLYLGVLNFWTTDRSPKQEDTLALLDQSLEMFARWLHADAPE